MDDDSANGYSSSDLEEGAAAVEDIRGASAAQERAEAAMGGMEEMDQIVEEDEAIGAQQVTSEDHGRRAGNSNGQTSPK